MDKERMIYHGSQKMIRTPVFGTANCQNDYGIGFYCTESLELTMEWARTEENSGYANAYKLDFAKLSVLNLFSHISFNEVFAAEKEIYYPKKMVRDQEARAAYRQERRSGRASDAIYLIDILRGEWCRDDPRLRRKLPG